ncbi:hypothetical protein Tco_1401129 [Tanacetum coccineum]
MLAVVCRWEVVRGVVEMVTGWCGSEDGDDGDDDDINGGVLMSLPGGVLVRIDTLLFMLVLVDLSVEIMLWSWVSCDHGILNFSELASYNHLVMLQCSLGRN